MDLLLPLAFYPLALVLLTFLGYGAAALLAPSRADRIPPPLVGYLLLLWSGYYAVRFAGGLPLGLALAGALALLFLALARRCRAPLDPPARPFWGAAALAGLVYLAAVLPLLLRGYPGPLGENWDAEVYVAEAAYLQDGPVAALADHPPNPLLRVVADPPKAGLTLGFSVLHGSLSWLLRQDPFVTFPWTLALGLALGAWALAHALRRLGLPAWAAALGGLLWGLHPLVLWTALFNFGMQVSAFPLVPLGWMALVEALEAGGARRIGAAALALALFPIAYYPALTVYVFLGAGAGLAVLLRRRRPRVVLRGLAVGLLALLLAWPTIPDYFAGFAYRYSTQMSTLGLFRYLSLAETMGLDLFRYPDLNAFRPAPWETALALLLLALAAGGLWRLGAVARGLAVGALLYLAWLRWDRAYPYAYMKGITYAVGLGTGGIAAGLAALREVLEGGPRPRPPEGGILGPVPRSVRRGILLALVLLPLGGVGRGTWTVVERYRRERRPYTAAVAAWRTLPEQLPAGAPVWVSSDQRLQGPQMGMLAYFLRRHPLYGILRTGYADFVRKPPPGELPPFALLHAAEDPAGMGYDPADRIWSDGILALYRRPPDRLAVEPLYRSLDPGLTLWAGEASLSADKPLPPPTSPRVLALSLAAFEPWTLRVDGRTLPIPAGQVLLRLPVPAEGRVALAGPGELLWAALEGEGTAPLWTPTVDPAVALVEAQAEGGRIQARVYLPRPVTATLALDVWGGKGGGTHHAWYGVQLPAAAGLHRVEMALDLEGRRILRATVDGATPSVAVARPFDPPQDGAYSAFLWLLDAAGQPTHRQEEFLTFRLEEGQLRDLEGRRIRAFARLP